jgi:phenylalanyl-tRNA synthetase beta chain
MNISINWLNSIFDINIPTCKVKQLARFLTFYGFNPNTLTLNGFEVEQIYNYIDNNSIDIIVEIDTTPNRRDLNSIFGICNELSILLNLRIAQKSFCVPNQSLNIKPNILKNVPVLRGKRDIFYIQAHEISLRESPRWLKNRLKIYDIETTNIFNDLTKYIQLEWGQTIHFYDLDKIKNFNFQIKKKSHKNLFAISNDKEIWLSECLTISNSTEILSLCGIATNYNMCVTEETRSVLIECISYTRSEIRRNQNISEAKDLVSIFNEKINDSSETSLATQRVLKLMSLYWKNIRFKKAPFHIHLKKDTTITLRYDQIHKILGKSKQNKLLTQKEIAICAERLRFPKYESEIANNQIYFQIPQSRINDLEEEIDLVEEIGRMYGFNNFTSKIPKFTKIGKITLEQQMIDQFRLFSINHGFYELINYSFLNNNKHDYYRLINPMSTGNVLQQSLKSNLLETINFNLKQQNYINRGFEVARVFQKRIDQEVTFFSGFISDEKYRNDWNNSLESYSWSNLKDLINNLIGCAGLYRIDWVPNTNLSTRQLHPVRQAILVYKSKTIGLIGQINPILAKTKNINNNTYLFELNLTLISQLSNITSSVRYKSFSSFPSIYRDVSFTIDHRELSSRYDSFLIEYINKSTTLVRKMYLKDSYDFNKDNKKYKTLTYSFIFQSKLRTLTNEEIEYWIKNLEFEISNLCN